MNWYKTGSKWMAATWIDDTQVIYKVRRAIPDWGIWHVQKKVSGAADPTSYLIGTAKDLDQAKALAVADSKKPL